MKTSAFIFTIWVSSLACASEPLVPLDVRHVKVGGEIGRRIDVTVTNNLLALNVDRDFVAPFKVEREKRSGSYIGMGKLIDAAVRLAAYTGGERVKTLKQHLASEAVAAQEADGYIGTMPPARRIWALWDIHEMGYLVYGLTMDYRFFGEKRSLDAARKLADYIITRWEAAPPKEPSPWDITLHMGVTGIENAMLALHQEAGEARYLDFVTKTRKLRDWDAHIVTGRWGPVEGHAYAHLCRCIAQLRLDRLRPDARLWQPTRDVLKFITQQDGLTITGECGDHECWHDTQEGTINLGETCATAYLIRWLDELLRREGDSLYGDLMERALYNGLFASQSPDGRQIRYYAPFEGPRSYFKGDTYCCPNNYRRIIAELPGMICYRSGEGLLVNLYTASEVKVDLARSGTASRSVSRSGGDGSGSASAPSISVSIRQETDYPNSGHVVIHVEPSKPATFPVLLRIPRWCANPTMTVNGTAVSQPVKSGAFFSLNREWKPGDRVELDMPMPWRLVKGRKAQAGRVAIMRGPQVFCLNPSRIKALANVDLKLLVIDPGTVEGPVADDSVRPGGQACRVKAWGPGAWYPQAKPGFTLELTEFADPGGEVTYFKVPNPKAKEFVEDELIWVE